MPTYQCTFGFVSRPEGGAWSHTWYREEASHKDAMTKAKSLASLIAKKQPPNVSIDSIRVSDVDILGDALLETNEPLAGGGALLAGDNSMGALVRFRVQAGQHVDQILKAATVGEITRGPNSQLILSATGKKRFEEWADAIISGGWLFRVQSTNQAESKIIEQIDLLLESDEFALTVAGFNPAAGAAIKIFGTTKKLWKSISGQQTVLKKNEAGQIILRAPIPCNQEPYYGGLKVVPVTYVYAPPTAREIRRYASRKSGRPFGQLRGRSSPLERHRQCLRAGK